MEPAVLGGLRLGDEKARRAIALADGLEADGIALQRIVDGERLGILEIAQRHDDRNDALLALEVDPGLAPGIVLPQLVAVGPAEDGQHEDRVGLLGGHADAVVAEELLHLLRQEAHGEAADVAAGCGGLLLDRQRAEIGGDVLGLQLLLQFGCEFRRAEALDQLEEGLHLHIHQRLVLGGGGIRRGHVHVDALHREDAGFDGAGGR